MAGGESRIWEESGRGWFKKKKREKRGKKEGKHVWRNRLEMILKSPRFKSVLLLKMQTWQIETRIKQYAGVVL